jgi:GtrA-like protein
MAMPVFSSATSDHVRFVRFLGAGVINTCFGYSAFAFFLWTGVGNDLAVVFGMIAGMLFNFGTFGAVFASRGFSRLPRFLAVYGSLLVLNIAALRWLTGMGLNAYLGQAIVVACIVPISFFAMRRIVFAPPTEFS